MSAASAQEFGFKKGDWDLTLTGAGSNDESFDQGGFSATGNLGYFIADQWSISLRQSAGYFDNDNTDGGSSWTGATRIATNDYFNLDRWQPYIGATGGYLYGDTFADSWVLGPEVGLRVFVNNTTFIQVSAGYEFFLNGSDDSDGQFIYSLGIGFKW